MSIKHYQVVMEKNGEELKTLKVCTVSIYRSKIDYGCQLYSTAS